MPVRTSPYGWFSLDTEEVELVGYWGAIGAVAASVEDYYFLLSHTLKWQIRGWITLLHLLRLWCRLRLVWIDDSLRLWLCHLLHGCTSIGDIVGSNFGVPPPLPFVCVNVKLHVTFHPLKEGELLYSVLTEYGEHHLLWVLAISLEYCFEALP